MIQTITRSEFTSAFHRMNRGNQFSHAGLLALYDYLVDYEEGTEQQIELDVIALCCEYTEFDDLEDFNAQYRTPETAYTSIDQIEEHTSVIRIDGSDGFIIAAY